MRRHRAGLVVVGMASWAVAAAPVGRADIIEYPKLASALPLAQAVAEDRSVIEHAVFSAVPPSGKADAVSTTPLAGFPRKGASFAILTTGHAEYAVLPNTSPKTGAQAGGPAIRGARDVTIMRIDLRIPPGDNCLSFRFRFLSEEFPEFVNSSFNDAFLAELDRSTWDASSKTNPTITAPRNFATDTKGNPIRVNAVGDASVTRFRAKGTTYDGATRLLRASTRITPGQHHLYLSIFDQGDRIYDSAVFLDQLVIGHRQACRTGVRADNP